MGYATYQTGDKGIIRRREYRMLVGSEVVPAVLVDGVPTSWKRNMCIGSVTETTREISGLSYADAHSTGTVTCADGSTVGLSGAASFTSGGNPLETYSREIERFRAFAGSKLWTVRITERNTSYSVTS